MKWKQIPPQSHEGKLLGYKIFFNFIDSPDYDYRGGTLNGEHVCDGSSIDECEIQNLALFINFSIQVAGFTEIGLGPLSPPIYVQTSSFGRLYSSFGF